MQRTPWGRVLRAIREDEDAARALGKNVFFYKLQSLGIAAALGAVAGFFFALNVTFPLSQRVRSDLTFFGYAMLVLGGFAATGASPSAASCWDAAGGHAADRLGL